MILLPDTNVWIRFLNPGENQVKDRFLSTNPATILLCSVVKAELFFCASIFHLSLSAEVFI